MLDDVRMWSEPAPNGWAQRTATIAGDPHMRGAYGGESDFRGRDGHVYALLSARNVTLNAAFEHRAYHASYSKLRVQGSWVMAVFLRLSTPTSTLKVAFLARDPYRAVVMRVPHGGGEARTFEVNLQEATTAAATTEASAAATKAAAVANGANATTTAGDMLRSPATVDGVRFSLTRKTLVVEHPFWRVRAQSTYGYPNYGQLRMNVAITPRYAVDFDRVAPHGLLGQTFDRSNCTAVFGKRDDYSRHRDGGFATAAAGEGAIEGHGAHYIVPSPFSTRFKYSRHTAKAAPPRDVHALGGHVREPGCARKGWDAAGGVTRLVDGLNFQGHDLKGLGRVPSAEACYEACRAHAPECQAFTFIKMRTAKKRCWLKRAGYAAGGFVANGTISGVLSAQDRTAYGRGVDARAL
eukprot:7379904-Prymnesium_polylepis.3